LTNIAGYLTTCGSLHNKKNTQEKYTKEAQTEPLRALVFMKLVPLFMVEEHQQSDQNMGYNNKHHRYKTPTVESRNSNILINGAPAISQHKK
jgi:hypothetical protein